MVARSNAHDISGDLRTVGPPPPAEKIAARILLQASRTRRLG